MISKAMSSATSDLCGYEQTILAAVRERREVIGLMNLLYRELGLSSPAWGKVCVKRLQARGLLKIKRGGVSKPLIIRSVQ